MSDANFQAHQREWKRQRDDLFAFEAKAGIRDDHKRFNEANSDNDLRRLYFSVRDKELRQDLIAKYRNFLRHANDYTPSRIRDADYDARAVETKGFSTPWAWPSLIVAGAVWIGWSFAALPGALAGTVTGFFAGNAYISNRRNAHHREVAAAQAELAELVDEHKREERQFGNPLVFSEQEEQSGSEDEGHQPEPDLHWFSRAGWDGLVAKELAKGADVEAENDETWGSRPLHRAAASGNDSIVKMLLDAGADPNATNRLHGFTPLHSAAAAGCASALKLLIESGAAIEAKDRYGFLPLHRAEESSDAESLRILVQAGSSVEADAHGSRSLHISARLGHPEAVEALLELGADPSVKNEHGAGPLDLASYGKGSKFDKTMELLRLAAVKSGKPLASKLS